MNGDNIPKMHTNNRHAIVSAFALAANKFFIELERDEEFVSENWEFGLGSESVAKSEIDIAISEGNTEALKDIQDMYLITSEQLAPDLRVDLNRRVKQASGMDFDSHKADLFRLGENILTRGKIESAEEYHDLERYYYYLLDSNQQSNRQLAADSLIEKYESIFRSDKADSDIIESGEKILTRGTILSVEEYRDLSDYRDYLLDTQEPSDREWAAEELLEKYVEKFDKPL